MSQLEHKPREVHNLYGWVVVGKRDGREHALHFQTKEEAMKCPMEGILMDERYFKEVYRKK